MYTSIEKGGSHPARFATPAEAVDHAAPGAGVLLLADEYPTKQLTIDDATLKAARSNRLRLYIEYPQSLPGLRFDKPRGVAWERAVVASGAFERQSLPKLRILSAQGCQFLPTDAPTPDLVLARVAGFDTAVYGLPKTAMPLLFRDRDGDWVATTKLSSFIVGRYAPSHEWIELWQHVLADLDPAGKPPRLVANPIVRPAYLPDAPLPDRADAQAAAEYSRWVARSGLLISPTNHDALIKLMLAGVETTAAPTRDNPAGDGSLGLMEGYASQIQPDGNQLRRTPIRADCQAESAMVLALHGSLDTDPRSRDIAKNLLNFLYFKSGMQAGARGNPKHPAFGLIAWGAVSPAWEVANYGDDNARTLLATMAAAASLKSDAWDESMLKALMANLRTTGKLGFRGDRIDIPALEANGWSTYHDASPVSYSPHFESYLWACDLWAYRQTSQREFLDKAETAIGMTMHAYPDGWRWGNNLERARMLLPLAWLIRIDDTPEHRTWLMTIAGGLLKDQQPCGSIPEKLRERATGFFSVPASNKAYGTGETPLIQENGDPVTDQLYTTGFALLGLHEAAAATGDAKLKAAENRLAAYLVRIQNRSDRIPYLDGTWFRAFDYRRWETWASSADIGWGAWSVEAGWGQAWAAATLVLRARQTCLWNLTKDSKIRDQLPRVIQQMSENDGGPWKPHK